LRSEKELLVLLMVAAMTVMQAPCAAEWPRLGLVIEGPGLASSLEPAIRTEATYEASQARLCVVGSQDVAATARLFWPEQGPIALSITSSPTFGQSIRQLSRTLEVGSVPQDGVALAIGSNLGELLREARREIPSLAPPPEPSAWGIGGLLAAEAYGGGQLHGGVELFGRVRAWSRLSIEATFGFRLGAEASARSGSVTTWLLGGALHAIVDVLRFGPFTLAAIGGGRLGFIHFEGRPRDQATGTTASTWISSLRAGVELGWVGRPAQLFVRLTAGLPLRSASATDGGMRVTGTTGVEGGAGIGFGGAF
jgi:hypothetical protein